MSWSRRRAGRQALVLAAALVLSGCGYQPLYGPGAAANTAEELSAVRINLVEDRLGQMLRNNLVFRMNQEGQPQAPEYELSVRLQESRQNLALRRDETATRANLIVRAYYELRLVGQERPLFTGRSQSVNSFNIVRSEFATLSAERDARERAAQQLSDDITTRLAIFFNSRRAT